MDNLVLEMCGESIDILGQMIVAKILQKAPEERRQVVNKILDVLFEPYTPKNESLERLVGILREMYDGLDEQTSKSLTMRVITMCMDVREMHDKGANNIAQLLNNNNNNNNQASFANEPKWLNKDKKIGKTVRIKIGTYCGMTAAIDGIDNENVVVKLGDGKKVKYSLRNVEFLE